MIIVADCYKGLKGLAQSSDVGHMLAYCICACVRVKYDTCCRSLQLRPFIHSLSLNVIAQTVAEVVVTRIVDKTFWMVV